MTLKNMTMLAKFLVKYCDSPLIDGRNEKYNGSKDSKYLNSNENKSTLIINS